MTVPKEKFYTREQLFAELNSDNVRGISKDIVTKAGLGDPRALHLIGVEYDLFRKEYAKALGWYLMSAELNHPAAQESVGSLYEKGHGVPVHFHIAMEWYLKAAKQKDQHSFSQIGDLFFKGLGVPLSKEKGLEWYYQCGKQTRVIKEAKNKGEYCLSKEQERKPLETLIQETEDILQYSIFRSLTYDGYKSIKANESNLINNIRVLQSSNNILLQMHEELNRKLTFFQSECKTLRESMELTTEAKEKEIRMLQVENSRFNFDTLESARARARLADEKQELEMLLNKEREDRKKDEYTFREKVTTEFTQKREELNLQLEQEKKHNALLEKLLEEERELKETECAQYQEKLKQDNRKQQSLQLKVVGYKSKIKDLQRATMDHRFRCEQLEKSLEQEKAEKRDLLEVLSQLHKSLENEKTNINTAMKCMQTSKTNLSQSTQKISEVLDTYQTREEEEAKKEQEEEEGKREQIEAAAAAEAAVEEEVEQVVTRSKAKAKARAAKIAEEEEKEELSLTQFKKTQSFTLYRPLLSQSVLLIRKELDHASEIRRKKRKLNAML